MSIMIHKHGVVVLTRDFPQLSLRKGDVGAVVHIYEGGRAYEVEFVTGSGKTLAVETFEPGDIRSFGAEEILHVRGVSAA
jgi:hypothetical protein